MTLLANTSQQDSKVNGNSISEMDMEKWYGLTKASSQDNGATTAEFMASWKWQMRISTKEVFKMI